MSQVLEKIYACKTCGKPIRIAKIDNVPPGQKRQWDKFEPDGVTPHQCKKQQQQPQPQPVVPVQLDDGPQIAALAKEVSELKETVNILISQVQMLRSEVVKGANKK